MFKKRNSQKGASLFNGRPAPSVTDEAQMKERIAKITQEFQEGFDFLKTKQKSVTIFGSAIYTEDNPYYQQAYELAKRIAGELDYTVLTGGGPGIMEAANRGANDAKGHSYAISIRLPNEQGTNRYATRSIEFHHFFARKVILSFTANAFIYFPGGFGTLDEFFEIMTLVHTKKIEHVPIILYGSEYWGKVHDFISEELKEHFATISEGDDRLYTVTDSSDEVLELIKNAPIRS